MGKLLILADDLTGAVDTAAFPVMYGENVIAHTGCGDFVEKEVKINSISINSGSRLLSKKEAYDRYCLLANEIKNYSGTIIKKIDMGFRGNPAIEIKALLESNVAPCCFLIPAIPEFRTFTLDGMQYVKGAILEQSLYATDPIHKPFSSYIPDIFEKLAEVKVGLINLDIVKSGDIESTVQNKLKEGLRIIAFDAVSDEDCQKIINTLYPIYNKVIWAGTLGLLRALCNYIYGGKEKSFALVKKEEKKSVADFRCAAFSGTKYHVTAEQICWAQHNCGLSVVPFNVENMYKTPNTEICRVKRICEEINKIGDFIVVPEVKGDFTIPNLPLFIEKSMAIIAKEVLDAVKIQRIAIIGGETALAVLNQIRASKLFINMKPESGIALGIIQDGIYAKKEIALKGGSVGSEKAVAKMLNYV